MAKEFIHGQILECTKGDFIMVNSMERESIGRPTGRRSTAYGRRVRRARYAIAMKNFRVYKTMSEYIFSEKYSMNVGFWVFGV